MDYCRGNKQLVVADVKRHKSLVTMYNWHLFQQLIDVCSLYTVSQKNDTDVARYNFDAHQPTLIIFGRESTLSNGDLLSHLS